MSDGNSHSQKRSGGKAPPVKLWKAVPAPPPPDPIRPADDPAALVRSLGAPPLQNQSTAAEHYMAAVVERAAGVATALAAVAGLLVDEAEDLGVQGEA